MSDFLPVENEPSFGRDINTGAIVNLNTDAYSAYIKAKREKEDLKTRVETVEQSLQEIKDMIVILLQRTGNR